MNLSFEPRRVIANARHLYQMHGLRIGWVAVQRLFRLFERRLFGPRSLQLNGQAYGYLVHPFTLDNERAVEIPIVMGFLKDKLNQEILEVGNVLPNYYSFPHDVVDKYEKAPGVINADIVDYNPPKKYDVIVSISTLEHVGWDETPRDPEKFSKAVLNLKRILKAGGQIIATIPLGYNPNLDRQVRDQQTGFTSVYFLKRISRNNQWRETRIEEVASAQYGSPFPCANAIAILRDKAECEPMDGS